METNTHICDCGRGYGETKSPSSCKWSIARKGLLCYVAKLALIYALKSVYLIATRDLSNLWLQFFLSQNQGFMRLFEKTVLK